MKVINLFAGPGAGKSTTAAGLFFLMKTQGHKVELVTEYAKDLHYEKNWDRMGRQLVVTAEQYHRIARLEGQVDWVITDSPIALGAIYASKEWEADAALCAFEEFDNYNFFVERVKPYAPYGRRQSEESARDVCSKVAVLLYQEGYSAQAIKGDERAPVAIYKKLFEETEDQWTLNV